MYVIKHVIIKIEKMYHDCLIFVKEALDFVPRLWTITSIRFST